MAQVFEVLLPNKVCSTKLYYYLFCVEKDWGREEERVRKIGRERERVRKIGRESNGSTNVDILTKINIPVFPPFVLLGILSGPKLPKLLFWAAMFFHCAAKIELETHFGSFPICNFENLGSFFHLMHHFISLS